MNCLVENQNNLEEKNMYPNLNKDTFKTLYKNNFQIKYENEIKLEVKSKSANEAFVRVAIAAFASQLDPTIEQIADIKTAVSEAITNCIINAYNNSEGVIKVNAYLTKDSIEIEIIDYGKGIENIDMARQT